MSKAIRNLYFLIAFFLLVGFPLSGAEEIEMKIPVMTVMSDKSTGYFYRLPFKYTRKDDGKSLRVSIVDDTPNGSKEGIRSSVWLAAVTLSMLKNDPLDGVSLSIEFTGAVDGPSAGGIFCLATWLAYEGKKIPDDFAMTGTIMPDGTIGVVGGVGLKIRAAAQKGIKRICIPAFIRFEEQRDGKYWDLYQEGEKYGVKIYPVKTISEAYEVVTGKKIKVETLPSENKILALPGNLEKALINSCTNSIKNFGIYSRSEHLTNFLEWKEISTYGAFPHGELYYENLWAFWDFLKRGKILSALEMAQNLRTGYGDYAKCDIFKLYDSLRTNEVVEIFRTKSGGSGYASFKKPPFNRYTREKFRKYAISLRSSLSKFQKILDAKIAVVLRSPFVADNNLSEIAAQSEQFDLEYLPLFLQLIDMYTSFSDKVFADANDEELYNYVLRSQSLIYYIDIYLNSFDNELSVKNRALIYSNLPARKPNSLLPQYEASFYSSLLSMCEVINNDYQKNKNFLESQSSLAEEINSGLENLIYRNFVLSTMHNLLDNEKQSNLTYHCCALLYQHSQALAKACALSVKFRGDANNSENIFAQYLIRIARESALRSIYDCQKAGIPCIDPILKFEKADYFMGKNGCDQIENVLENYWCAHLGAKALLVGFEGKVR